MRELVLKMSVSVDGFVGGPNGEVDWVFDSVDEAVTAWLVETLWNAGVHIMGSRTFADMAAHWPASTEPYAPPMNEIPKIVFSRRGPGRMRAGGETTAALEDAQAVAGAPSAAPSPHAASWSGAAVAAGDLADQIAALKRQPGKPILAHGGARFARSLVRLGLVDEYRLLVHPVALGAGLPLFSDLPAPRRLRLLSTTAFGGAVAQVYRPA